MESLGERPQEIRWRRRRGCVEVARSQRRPEEIETAPLERRRRERRRRDPGELLYHGPEVGRVGRQHRRRRPPRRPRSLLRIPHRGVGAPGVVSVVGGRRSRGLTLHRLRALLRQRELDRSHPATGRRPSNESQKRRLLLRRDAAEIGAAGVGPRAPGPSGVQVQQRARARGRGRPGQRVVVVGQHGGRVEHQLVVVVVQRRRLLVMVVVGGGRGGAEEGGDVGAGGVRLVVAAARGLRARATVPRIHDQS